jgi:hypothetical protein
MKSDDDLSPRYSPHYLNRHQSSLFVSTREEFVAEVCVSADEMGAWHRKGWLSFDPLNTDHYDDKEHAEVRFIKGLTRSGLSDAMINRTLSSLQKPYCYDSSTTFVSFVKNRWISLPPERDPAEVTSEYLDGLVEIEDWDALRELRNKVSLALENAEATNSSSFGLRKADLRMFRDLEGAFRNLLKISGL